MAQYVPYIPEVLPETPLFKPDFNFFDRMMQRKQSMFEQGLSKARSAYTSVLNAPLSVKENIPLRDQFVKDAKENLKTLASADLSLPQNVAAAENIFAPFWQDKYILKDMELTKSYQNGFEMLDAWKNSPDPKVREQYSGITEKYLMNGYETLQNATRNDQSFAGIERRKPIAFTNIQAYLEDAAQKSPDKLKIVWDQMSPDGAYLISTVNGERVKESFASWAASQIGNNFYQQFNVTGIVEKEERMKMVKRMFPGISDQEAITKIGDGVIVELKEGYDKRKNSLSVEEARINAMIKSMPSTLTPDQAKQLEVLTEQLATLEGKKSALDVDYKNFEQSKDVRRQSVLQNPDAYFATLAKQRVIDGWATGRASVSGNKITTNEAYFKAQDLFWKQKEYERNIANDAWDRKVDEWNMVNGKKAGNSGRNSKSKGTGDDDVMDPNLAEGYDPVSGGVYTGLGSKDITKTGSAYDNYMQKMDEKFLTAHDRIFDTRGVLMFAKNLGMTDEELMNVASALKKEVRSLKTEGNYNFTPEESKAAKKLEKLLKETSSVKSNNINITGPLSLRNALIAYAGEYMKDKNEKSKDGIAFMSEKELNAMMSYVTATQDLATYEANEKKRQELINKHILSDEKTYGKIITVKNGQKNILTTSDIAGDLKTNKVKVIRPNDVSSDPQSQLSNNDFAAAILAGKVTNPYTVRIGKDEFETRIDINGTTYALMGNAEALVKKYGDLNELAPLYKSVQQNITPDLLYYSSQTGKMGVEFTHQFDKKKSLAEDKNSRIFNAALNTANAEFYDKDGKELSAATIEKLKSLLGDEASWETYVGQFTYVSQGINGRPTIRFSISDKPSESGKAGVNVDDIKAQTFNLAILPTNTSPDLRDLPNNTGMYMYDQLLRGKPIKSDPVVSASGFDFTIMPDDNQNPTSATVSLSYNIRKNKRLPDGSITTVVEPVTAEETFNLKGDGSKTPDELVSYIYSLYFKNLKQNQLAVDEFNATLRTNPGTTTYSKEDILKSKGITIK